MEMPGLLPTLSFVLSSDGEEDLLSAPPKSTNISRTPDDQSPQTVVPLVRGRGRPPKNGVSAVNRFPMIVEPRGRGRPPKRGRGKVTHPIVPTGKGRGRPKKRTLSDSDEESTDSSDDDSDHKHHIPPNKQQKVAAKTQPGKRRGRPKKIKHSDDESDDEYERQPVGRPATGAVNLNIERTGRGQGRPKKDVRLPRSNISYSGTNDEDNNVVDSGVLLLPKKRGRPSKGGSAAPKVSSGRPRGRPKTKVEHVQSSESDDDNDYEVATDKVLSDEHTDDDNDNDIEDSSHNVVSDLVVKP